MGKSNHPWWRFVLTDRMIHEASNAAAIKRFKSLRSELAPFAIYKKVLAGGWEFHLNVDVQPDCICGKSFTNSINNVEFREPHITQRAPTREDMLEIFKQPDLCQECFYRLEWLAKKWCPKYWKTKFES